MKIFRIHLLNELKQSSLNNFGKENYDEYRFGIYPKEWQSSFYSKKKRLKNLIKFLINYNKLVYPKLINRKLEIYIEELETIYSNLNGRDKELLVKLIAFRLLGFRKVKLPRNNKKYWNSLKTVEKLADKSNFIDPDFIHFILYKIDLNEIGQDVKIYHSIKGVAIDFLVEQYAYKNNSSNNLIYAEENDVVLDLGGCWGDTALYFANKVGPGGHVYTFEFIPKNINIMKKNINLNPSLDKNITVIQNPVTDKSGVKIYYKDRGPSSQVLFHDFDDKTGETQSISIDDLLGSGKLERVDYIKMDIEGAETMALEGAKNTIKKFRPKLAIAIYHSLDDFVKIPNWIMDLKLDYEIFIDHFSIHAEETICFARPKNIKNDSGN